MKITVNSTFQRVLASFLVAGLAACGGGGDSTAGGTPRDYERTDSEVTALPNGLGWTASRVVTISNDDGGATRAVVSLANVAGSITSSASSDGYQIQVTLTADGETEAEARAVLATMAVSHRDALDPGTLYLDNAVTFGDYSGSQSRTATVTAALPPALDYQLSQQITAGSASSSGLQGAGARLETTAGAASLSGTWDAAALYSSSGGITATGDIADLQAATVSGTIQATLACVRSTRAGLDTVSGAIDVTVAQNVDSGFDLVADTTSGTAAIVVAGTQPVGEQSTTHAHYQSPGYAESDPRISVVAQSTSGGVLIHE